VTAEDAYNAICVSAGDFTSKAREFAAGRPIHLLHGTELAALVGAVEVADAHKPRR
jgi:hypothetical protein